MKSFRKQTFINDIAKGRGRSRNTIGEIIKSDTTVNGLNIHTIYDSHRTLASFDPCSRLYLVGQGLSVVVCC